MYEINSSDTRMFVYNDKKIMCSRMRRFGVATLYIIVEMIKRIITFIFNNEKGKRVFLARMQLS